MTEAAFGQACIMVWYELHCWRQGLAILSQQQHLQQCLHAHHLGVLA